jgi:hypothetical protein
MDVNDLYVYDYLQAESTVYMGPLNLTPRSAHMNSRRPSPRLETAPLFSVANTHSRGCDFLFSRLLLQPHLRLPRISTTSCSHASFRNP